MTSDSVLVVIPCLNEAENLPVILEQLLSDANAGTIVVADGGSTDGSRELVQRRAETDGRLHLLDNPDRLQSAGVNLAVRQFAGSYRRFVRIDAHCVYPDDYLSRLVAAADSTGAQSVVVPMATLSRGGFQEAVATAQNSRLGTGGSAHRSGNASGWVEHGHHALMEVEAFIAADGYCEAMACNEDAELDHRIAVQGGRIWLARECEIGYFPRATPKALARQYWRYGVGRAQTVVRHRIKLRPRQAIPLAVAPSIALAALGPLHWIFLLPAGTWLSACLAGGLVLGLRRKSAWAFASGLAAAIMHASWSAGFFSALLDKSVHQKPRYGFTNSA